MSCDLNKKAVLIKVFIVLAILSIVSLSLICRYRWLPQYPYHEDGIATIEYLDSIVSGLVSFEELIRHRSPLGHVLLSFPLFFVDASIYTYRLTNLFFFAGVLLLLVLIGRQTGHFWAGVLAMIFVAFSSLEGLFVGFVRFYLVFQFFFLLVWYLFGQYFFLKKRHAGVCLFLAFLAGIFVHEFSLQLFPLAGLAIAMNGSWFLRRRGVWLPSLVLIGCAFFFHVGTGFTLAPKDFNELTIGTIGSVFSSGNSGVFYDYFKVYVPFGWALMLCGSIIAFKQKNRITSHYYLGFFGLFLVTSILAPGDSPHYISHLFPVGVFCGMMGLTHYGEAFLQGVLTRDTKMLAVSFLIPVLVAGMLLVFDLETLSHRGVFGAGLTFLDERPPHNVLGKYVKGKDIILSVDPEVTRFYVKKGDVLLLRQKHDMNGVLSSYQDYKEDYSLIDSVEKINYLLNNTESCVFVYGNKKYQYTVGKQMRNLIDKNVEKIIYYDEKNNIFILKINKCI